jgi:hypothetical protein
MLIAIEEKDKRHMIEYQQSMGLYLERCTIIRV